MKKPRQSIVFGIALIFCVVLTVRADRYFIIEDTGAIIRYKLDIGGDPNQAPGIVSAYLLPFPGWTSVEVSSLTFVTTPIVVDPTTARSAAITQLLNDPSANAKLERAIILTLLTQLNTIRALLPTPLGPITVPQMETAVENTLNSGAAD